MQKESIQITSFTFNAFSENTYVLSDETKEAIIIDPGCSDVSEENELKSFITENELKPVKVALTHSHIDHVLGIDYCTRTFDIPLCIYEEDVSTLKMNEVIASHWGFPQYQSKDPDEFMSLSEGIHFGSSHLEIRFAPGHAPGHVIFYHPGQKFVIGGDVLFRESIGRFDLPGGDHQTLLTSIQEQLFSLPDDVTVYPGHGPTTTIGHEKIHNPFVGA